MTETCYGGLTFRNGCFVSGYLRLMVDIIIFPTVIIKNDFLLYCKMLMEDKIYESRGSLIFMLISLAFLIIVEIICITFLLVAMHQNKMDFLKAFTGANGIAISIDIGFVIGFTIGLYQFGYEILGGIDFILLFIALLIQLGFHWYSQVVVLSYRIQLLEEIRSAIFTVLTGSTS